MAFTVKDFHDLVRILEEHPEWRAELRRLLLSEELLRLPELVERLGERIERLEAAVEELVGAHIRAEERLTRLEEVMARAEERLGRIEGDMAHLKGWSLEWRYREKAPAYFGRVARELHPLPPEELAELLGKAVDQGLLAEEEMGQVLETDLVIRGLRNGEEIWLVVEISWGIGVADVERAKERAEILARAGLRALAVVAGKGIAPEAAERARALGVWQVLDGHPISPN
ncbi:MAG: hypothetical protein ACPLZE_07110 [Candidatus Bipolaricaulaceae bacterium]